MRVRRKFLAMIFTVVLVGGVTGCTTKEQEQDKTEEAVQESVLEEAPVNVTEEAKQERPEEALNAVQLNLSVREWPVEWDDRGEVEFVVDKSSSQFQHGDYEMPEEAVMEKVNEAIGKRTGDYFTLQFEYGDCAALEQFIILEVKKNTTLGNVAETVEYGDTLKATYRHGELMAEYAEQYPWEDKGNGTYLIDASTTVLEGVDYEIPKEIAKSLYSQISEKRDEGTSIYTKYADLEKHYAFEFTVMGAEGTKENKVSLYTFPDNWNYQFGPTRIGSYYVESTEDPIVIENENGEIYGFEEWLGGGCSSWCGCDEFYSVATASSTLASQGENQYVPNNVAFQMTDYAGARNSVWAEGVEGDGIGESIELKQLYKGSGEDVFTFKEICIVNGYAQNETKWQNNNRVKALKLYYEDEYMGMITLEDTIKPQYVDVSPLKMTVKNGEEAKFKFEIAEVYEGAKYEDTCITGIVIEFDGRYAH